MVERGVMAQSEDQLLKQILDRLVPAFQPSKVVLFGSHATETANADSDFDLIFVLKERTKKQGDLMIEASHLLRGIEAPVDVFFYSEQEYEEKLKDFGSIPETAQFEGQKVLVDVGL